MKIEEGVWSKLSLSIKHGVFSTRIEGIQSTKHRDQVYYPYWSKCFIAMVNILNSVMVGVIVLRPGIFRSMEADSCYYTGRHICVKSLHNLTYGLVYQLTSQLSKSISVK